MIATELKEHCPFFLLFHSKNQQQDSTQSHMNDALFLRLGGSIRCKQIKRPSHAYSKRKKRTPHFSLISVTDLWGERDCCQTQKLTPAHTHNPVGGEPCWVSNEAALCLLSLLSHFLGEKCN